MDQQTKYITTLRLKPVFLHSILFLIWLSVLIGLHYLLNLPNALSVLLVVPYLIYAKQFGTLKKLSILNLSSLCLVLLIFLVQTPNNDRIWDESVAKLPIIQYTDNSITIENMRNFQWHGPNDYNSRWQTSTYNLEQLTDLELIVVPFGLPHLTAHTMLSFGFSNGERIIVSIEARKEANESYGLIAGALRQFELIYIFGTEEDLLKLRAIHRNNEIYAFPVKATHDFMRKLLIQLSNAANQIYNQPQFYSVLIRNCTTSLIQAINQTHSQPIGFRLEAIFPTQAGKLLHQLGYMDTELSYEHAIKQFRMDEAIREFRNHPQFSKKIREPKQRK